MNVDLGEAYGNYKCGPDEELIQMIDHANVACGFHAGYAVTISLPFWGLSKLTSDIVIP